MSTKVKCADCVYCLTVAGGLDATLSCEAPGSNVHTIVFEGPVECPKFEARVRPGVKCADHCYQEKPPLGVMPEDLWVEERVRELIRGLHERRQYIRKVDCETEPQLIDKWLNELQHLLPLLRIPTI